MPYYYWKNRIESALNSGKLELYCQPIVAEDRSVYAEELLLRLVDQNKPVPAIAFIDAISVFPDLIWLIDKWVIAQAMKLDHSSQLYHLNISGFSISKKGLADYVQGQASACGVDPKQLHFEITEQFTIEDYDQVEALKDLGCRFILDDLWNGFNCFNKIQRLQPTVIKIPGQIILLSQHDKLAELLVEATFGIAAILSIKVVAEAIETEECWSTVKRLKQKYPCELYGQGYLFGYPQKCGAPHVSPSY